MFIQFLKPLFRIAVGLCFIFVIALVLTVNLRKEKKIPHEHPTIISVEIKEFFDMKSGG